jgi:hypothetical protein
MTRSLIATRIRFMKAMEAREAGQGTLEYVGMIVAVAVIVVAVAAALKATNIQGHVTDAFNSVFGG